MQAPLIYDLNYLNGSGSHNKCHFLDLITLLETIMKYRNFYQILFLKFRKCFDSSLQNATFIKREKILMPRFYRLYLLKYSKCPTYESSSFELSKKRMYTGMSKYVS